MYPFEYKVTLCLRHPNADPQKISTEFGMQPTNMWKVGEDKKTFTGRKLEGKNTDSFWCAQLHPEDSLNSEKKNIVEFLFRATRQLYQHKAFLNSFHSSGGTTEYFIGLWGTKNFGEIIPSTLFMAFADLNIDLALDIYPNAFPEK